MSGRPPAHVEPLQATQDLQIETGSLHPALHRLEARGRVAAARELSDKGKRARYYRLTPRRRKQPTPEQSKWAAFSQAMGLIPGPPDQEAS